MKQTAEITFETEETIVLRQGSAIVVEFCSGCGERVLMASPQTIAVLSGVSEREIFRLVEANQIHFAETGCILICMKSANESLEERHEKAKSIHTR
ncbi:MAG: hypothetical protein ABR535_06285 [Pyrinomonadaceae bacterium]